MDFATRDRYRHAVEELARGSGLHRGRGRPAGPWTMAEAAPTATASHRRSARRRDPGYYLIADGRAALERALARSGAAGGPAAARLRPSRRRDRLPRDDRARHGARPRRAAPAVRRRRRSRCRHPRRRDPRARPGLRPRDRPRQPGGHQRAGPEAAAPARPGRRRAARAADARRRADAPHQRGGRRGAGRRPGGPLPGEPRGRCAVRAAVGLARRRRPSTSPATTSSSRRRRRPSTGSTSATARPPAAAPGSCSSTGSGRWNEAEGCWMGWERKRGKLHELNALLRGSTTTGILTTGRAASTPPTGRALRGHARCRHAAAAGRRRAPRRDDRPSAQPADASTARPAG